MLTTVSHKPVAFEVSRSMQTSPQNGKVQHIITVFKHPQPSHTVDGLRHGSVSTCRTIPVDHGAFCRHQLRARCRALSHTSSRRPSLGQPAAPAPTSPKSKKKSCDTCLCCTRQSRSLTPSKLIPSTLACMLLNSCETNMKQRKCFRLDR